jgi:hypothetical protein
MICLSGLQIRLPKYHAGAGVATPTGREYGTGMATVLKTSRSGQRMRPGMAGILSTRPRIGGAGHAGPWHLLRRPARRQITRPKTAAGRGRQRWHGTAGARVPRADPHPHRALLPKPPPTHFAATCHSLRPAVRRDQTLLAACLPTSTSQVTRRTPENANLLAAFRWKSVTARTASGVEWHIHG